MQNKFSKESLDKLKGIDSRLQVLAHRVLETHDCKVIYGLRTLDEQKQLLKEGLTRTLNSKHIEGRAIDLAPYPVDWQDTKRFYYFAGIVMATASDMEIGIRWGGDWDSDNDLNDQTFMDLIHFELKNDA